MPTDPYGTDLVLTPDGDLAIWPNGQLATITGPENAIQALRLRLITREGDLPVHPEYGSGLPDRIGSKNDTNQLVAQANTDLKELFTQDRRFLGLTELSAVEYEPGKNRLQATVQLALGEQLELQDLQNPGGNIEVTGGPNPRIDELTLPDEDFGVIPDPAIDQQWQDDLDFAAGDLTTAQAVVAAETLTLVGDPRVDQDARLEPIPPTPEGD